MTAERVAAIESELTRAFAPEHLLVKDQSHLHAGHAGARDGKGHFEVHLVSGRFAGVSRIERHRLVHEALAGLLQSDIHALSLRLETPDEIRKKHGE